ncbi:unnamed protein product [Adineta steineri]|uniref:Hexosyltransferase n=1 Tax=Adineta steineri TaxID=433720 RepID=A0A814BXS1_9BILA|nr:unnamed protein product [Adineta steineri]CAF3795314.1 unnamed protein product [Adineta steineri]
MINGRNKYNTSGYDHDLQLLNKIYFTSINCLRRYGRRRLCIPCFFFVILCCNLRMLNGKPNVHEEHIDRSVPCNQSSIRKHFMNNLRPEELFTQNLSQSSFTYEISNENFCSLSAPHALIFVISKSTNFGSRNAIRRTWGDFTQLNSIEKFVNLKLKLLFLIDIDAMFIQNVNLEQSLYHDLVQVRLPQHYSLSTYRDMAILDWTETYCSQALLTIKSDDDVFLNMYLLANVLTYIITNTTISTEKLECKHVENLNSMAVIYGFKFQHAHVVRHAADLAPEEARYIITDNEYPCTHYPDFMSGFGYIINRNARLKLLCAFFRHQKSFHLSDVYITGILAEYLNIQRQHLRFKINYESADECVVFFNQKNAYACASSLHYKEQTSSLLKDVYIFERFYTYWKRVHQNQRLFINYDSFY